MEIEDIEMKPMTRVNTRPTVVLADDHFGVLESVSKLLSPGFNILSAVSDGWMALEACVRLKPEIAVLDITMPELDGLGTARGLKNLGSSTRIVFLTVKEDEDYIAAALDLGASGYVLKSRMQSDLIPAIEHALADGGFVFP